MNGHKNDHEQRHALDFDIALFECLVNRCKINHDDRTNHDIPQQYDEVIHEMF